MVGWLFKAFQVYDCKVSFGILGDPQLSAFGFIFCPKSEKSVKLREFDLFMPFQFSIFILFCLCLRPATGMVFRDGPSPSANTETAPTGPYAESGWQFQLRYFLSAGTIISPKHFITAVHLGETQTEVTQEAFLNGSQDLTFHLKGSRQRIAETDLAVFEIWETFPAFASLYPDSDESAKEVVVFGRGYGRGVELPGQGWKWGPLSSAKARWGRNQIDGSLVSGDRDLLYFAFNDLLGQDEAMLTGLDSGGGWFIQHDSEWKLAAVSYSVDSFYSDSPTPSDANRFRGAFYRADSLSYGSDVKGWRLIPDSGFSDDPEDIRFYRQSHSYGSRISTHLTEIQAIINPALIWANLTPLEKFNTWLGEFGLTSDPSADDDQDGQTNLIEYLTDSSPNNPHDTVAPLTFARLPNGDHQLTLTHTLDLEGRHLTYQIQQSPDFLDWQTIPDLTERSSEIQPSVGRKIITYIQPPNGPDSRFYRLKVVLL